MFCHYCGKEIKGEAKFCPYCGSSIPENIQDKDNRLTAHRKAATQSQKNHDPKRRRSKWLLIISLIIIAVISTGVLIIRKELLNRDNRAETGSDQLVLSNEMYITAPAENDIVEYEGIEYVDGELILHAAAGTDKSDIVGLIEQYEGKIIGEISVTYTYQVRFERKYSYDELSELLEILEKSDLIEWGSIDVVFEQNLDYYPISDKEWSQEWGDDEANGVNWGVEAIYAPQAWDYRGDMSYVNIGIVDNVFLDHKDIVYAERFLNHSENPISHYTHGTHVAGTIAAGFDNGIGISGVMPYANLFCYSYATSEVLENKSDLLLFEYALTQLICVDQCKVINISLSTGEEAECFAASNGDVSAINDINYNAGEVGKYLKCLVDLDYDFLLCVAAGNANGYEYVKDSSKPYGYREETSSDNPTGGNLAQYSNFLNAISISEVRSRIVVVGSCNQSGAYSYFSNAGLVDVVAPGELIYSTVDKDEYGSLNGTSMATPHITGIAAMLFSLDENLTGPEVKRIIIDTATTEVENCDYKMANAYLAVREVVENTDYNWAATPESLLYVYNKDNELSNNYFIDIYPLDAQNLPENSNSITYTVTNAAPFELVLAEGEYQIVIRSSESEDIYPHKVTVSRAGSPEHTEYTTYESATPVSILGAYANEMSYLYGKNYWGYLSHIYYDDGYSYTYDISEMPLCPLGYCIDDIDNDGDVELLVIDITGVPVTNEPFWEVGTSYAVNLLVYECESGEAVLADKLSLVDEGITLKTLVGGKDTPSGILDCYLYGNNQIGIELSDVGNALADGDRSNFVSVRYDGTRLVLEGHAYYFGSSWEYDDEYMDTLDSFGIYNASWNNLVAHYNYVRDYVSNYREIAGMEVTNLLSHDEIDDWGENGTGQLKCTSIHFFDKDEIAENTKRISDAGIPVEVERENEVEGEVETPRDSKTSGPYGNLTWSYDGNGTLTFSGNGPLDEASSDIEYMRMDDGYVFEMAVPPWDKYTQDIHSVVIDEGVTAIYAVITGLGDGAVPWGMTIDYATSITIPRSVTYIEDEALDEFGSLEVIYGYLGSAAEGYANKYGLRFLSLDANGDTSKSDLDGSQTHAIIYSEDEAYQIAYEYWDYTPGDISEEGYEMYVFCGGTLQQSGKTYYIFSLRWYVDDPGFEHESTLDNIYIDAEIGECIPYDYLN